MTENARPLLRAGVLTVAASVLLGAAGCQHAGVAEDRLVFRSERVARTARAVERRESLRPQRLERTLREIDRDLRRAAAASRTNIAEIDVYHRDRWQRWSERQPVYQYETRRILGGKPERIEPNAIILFF
jgi:hypothetical protein